MTLPICFRTPGLLDIRAFTIMGASAKPNSSNPIGFFGTGLKYAIAGLVRLGAEPEVWIGEDHLKFSRLQSKFRGKDLETVQMAVTRAGQLRCFELPFTTHYGAKWEPWMLFRELESNTRDENGSTWELGEDEILITGEFTTILVDLPEFHAAWQARDQIFLPGATRNGEGILEAFPGESEQLYYRTMRAKKLQKPSVFTYNFLEQLELSEDRQIAYEFYAKQALARWVLSDATVEQVEQVLKVDKEKWEYGLEFPAWVKPSAAFETVMTARRRGISRPAFQYYASYAPSARRLRQESHSEDDFRFNLFHKHPKPWSVDGLVIVDAKGGSVLAAPDEYYDDWEETAKAICERIRVTGNV